MPVPWPCFYPPRRHKHKTTGFNGRAIANLRGDLLFVSEPATGHNRDMTALAETETADIVAAAYSGHATYMVAAYIAGAAR